MLDSILGFIGKGIDAFTSSSNTEKNNATQLQIAAQNIALQKEFAQHGLSWKIDDAATRGIHPLAALGSQAQSFSPVSVGLDKPTTDFGSMGQDLGRALKETLSQADRREADQREATKISLEKGRLENDVLRAELASKVARTRPVGPGLPDSVTVTPARIPLPRPGPDRSVSGWAVADDDMKQKQADHPALKTTRPLGYELYTNPYFSDGQTFEDRYGDAELFNHAKAGLNLVADHVWTGYQKWPWFGDRGPSPTRDERREFFRRTQGWR